MADEEHRWERAYWAENRIRKELEAENARLKGEFFFFFCEENARLKQRIADLEAEIKGLKRKSCYINSK